MKAFFLVKNGHPDESFELRHTSRPPLMKGDVRIKVSAFGLNYSDVLARQGLYRECPPLPCIIGYDVEGTIDEVAPDVAEFRPGERVFALSRFGGYAQYVCTQHVAVNHLPESAPIGAGCALATQSITGYHGAIHTQTLMPGEKVLIHAAAGGLGTSLIQLAKWKGCIVIGVAGGSEKADYLKSLGVDHVIDHHVQDYVEYVSQHLDGKVDVIFDNIGGSSFKKGKSILARGGRIVSLGASGLSGKKGFIPLIRLVIGFGLFSPIAFLTKSQSLIGINMLKIADYRPDIIAEEFRQVARLYEEGVLQPHIGKVFSQNELPLAHAWMENRQSIGKGVIRWDD
jgi:NADPH2:quinone reductase